MSKYPKVVIVGRVNVGKSTLFNRFSEKERSIVYNKPGVTRDFIEETISWKSRKFDLIDSGGLFLKKNKDSILDSVQRSVLSLIETADILPDTDYAILLQPHLRRFPQA